MDTREIQKLIDFISKSDLNEVNIETAELKLSIKRNAGQIYQSAPIFEAQRQQVLENTLQAMPAPTPVAQEENTSHLVEIKAPMIGTFYRSAGPDKPLFVELGDEVTAGKTICILEAMKLFNEIESEISGRIVKILVEDATPVEYDQPLFLVDPS